MLLLGRKKLCRLPGLLPQLFRRSSSSSSSNLSRIRNVGILAHIDAGKTTTTERMLYYAGFMKHVGEVHRGDTVMDYMEQERDRGITITSAAITFPWNGHQINLIDTPGHVDFTVEVERSVRVLDGGVVILDGSAGVEAQTLTVWRQADRYKLPRVVFINKMDKPNADFEMSVTSMVSKLHVEPLIIQRPLGSDTTGRQNCTGILDVVNMRRVIWDESSMGRSYKYHCLEEGDQELSEARDAKAELVEKLCEYDETLAELVIELENYVNVPPAAILKSLRKVTLADNNALVTLCGSAYKNFGVQTLMDAIVEFLPSPADLSFPFLRYYNSSFCGLAFKTIHHPQKGVLTFVRVYGGTLREGDTIFNMSDSVKSGHEKVAKLMVAFADDFKQVGEVTAGNVAVISGLKDTSTGDTLVESAALAKSVITQWEQSGSPEAVSPFLPGVSIPDPVFYCSIEPPSMKDQKQLDLALKNLAKEDPSLRVSVDPDTGQTVLSGMGELHLDIVRDRIAKEYKVDADLGTLMIAYREAAVNPAREDLLYQKRILNKDYVVTLDLEVEASAAQGPSILVMSHAKESKEVFDQLRHWQMKEIRKGFQNAIDTGPLLQYPVVNSKFILHSIEISPGTSGTLITSAVSEAVKKVMKASGSCLLEPIMRLEITTDSEMVSTITQDLVRRRGNVGDVEIRHNMRIITAMAPLSSLSSYSSRVRELTSGRALFGMEFSHYEVMEIQEQNRAIEAVTGFHPSS